MLPVQHWSIGFDVSGFVVRENSGVSWRLNCPSLGTQVGSWLNPNPGFQDLQGPHDLDCCLLKLGNKVDLAGYMLLSMRSLPVVHQAQGSRV